MAETVDLSLYTRKTENGSAEMDLAVDGITCAACLDDIENGLHRLPGVEKARLNLTSHRLAVSWKEGEASASGIINALASIGYKAYPFEQRRVEADEAAHTLWLLKCLGVAGFAAMNIMLLSVSVWAGNATIISQETRDFFHWCSALIALPAAAYAGQPFFLSALTAIRNRRLNMDVPISLGIVLALGMSVVETLQHAEHAYFDSAVMLLLFLLSGRYLDQAMRRKTRAAAGNLAALKGDLAHRIESEGDNALTAVPVAALKTNDLVLVRPGERVPADGIVVAGEMAEGAVGRGVGQVGVAGQAQHVAQLVEVVVVAQGQVLVEPLGRHQLGRAAPGLAPIGQGQAHPRKGLRAFCERDHAKTKRQAQLHRPLVQGDLQDAQARCFNHGCPIPAAGP